MIDLTNEPGERPTPNRRLIAWREEKGWSLAQAGTYSGTSHQTIANYETWDPTRWKSPTLGRILRAYGHKLEELDLPPEIERRFIEDRDVLTEVFGWAAILPALTRRDHSGRQVDLAAEHERDLLDRLVSV